MIEKLEIDKLHLRGRKGRSEGDIMEKESEMQTF